MGHATATWLALSRKMPVIHTGPYIQKINSFVASSVSFSACHLSHSLLHSACLIARQSVFMSGNTVANCHLIKHSTAISMAMIFIVILSTSLSLIQAVLMKVDTMKLAFNFLLHG